MKRFAAMFDELDATTRINDKVETLRRYFAEAPAQDAAWALSFLLGAKLPRCATSAQLRQWAAEQARLPVWLMDECYEAVGDLAETIALVLPPATKNSSSPDPTPDELTLHDLAEGHWRRLIESSPSSRQTQLRELWRRLDGTPRFVFNKLLTGNFRVGVARGLVARALAQVAGTTPAVMQHRLMGPWVPTESALRGLLSGETTADRDAQPYPFFLASPIEARPDALGAAEDWQIEWKWDGVRAQLVRRNGRALLWSRGEELVTESFPEIAETARALPDGTVLDGELLAWRGDRPLPFADLQRRLGRKKVGAKMRAEVPVTFMAYDILERNGEDVRSESLAQRRAWLEDVMGQWTRRHAELSAMNAAANAPAQAELSFMATWHHPPAETRFLQLSPVLNGASWDHAQARHRDSRAQLTEGVMLKRRSSPYGVGRQRGDWWKWKVDPLSIDAVLVAAQPGHGRRASLFTDYTFALWDKPGGELITVAKAYSGLTDAEIKEVDAFVRQATVKRFGPVRGVTPRLVFELAFEGIRESSRHKAGLALRFPRIHRWRRDKKPEDADTITHLRTLLRSPS